MDHCSQGKKYFPYWSPKNLKKISLKMEKISFYLVFLAIFYYSVISDSAGHLAIKFMMSGAYIIILKKKIFPQINLNFTT